MNFNKTFHLSVYVKMQNNYLSMFGSKTKRAPNPDAEAIALMKKTIGMIKYNNLLDDHQYNARPGETVLQFAARKGIYKKPENTPIFHIAVITEISPNEQSYEIIRDVVPMTIITSNVFVIPQVAVLVNAIEEEVAIQITLEVEAPVNSEYPQDMFQDLISMVTKPSVTMFDYIESKEEMWLSQIRGAELTQLYNHIVLSTTVTLSYAEVKHNTDELWKLLVLDKGEFKNLDAGRINELYNVIVRKIMEVSPHVTELET